MTVFIAHAPNDAPIAEALESFLERRGQFVERDDGETALRPITPRDVMVLLVSEHLSVAPMRLRLEQRALDAWAENRLILIKLDHGPAPLGLRDLAAIDARTGSEREAAWHELAGALGAMLRQPSPHASQAPGPGRRVGATLLASLLTLAGLAACVGLVLAWLAGRSGAAAGEWAEWIAAVEALGAGIGLSAGASLGLFAGAAALVSAFAALAFVRLVRARVRAPASRPQASPSPSERAVFVSYARANQGAVLPVLEGAKQAGRRFWLDQHGLAAGEAWAGELVRAVRGAAGVVVMCSRAAFESDHVKRAVYLADRYRRKLIPVYIEDADPPEDFEYFFAGVRQVNLYETPEGERPQALAAALGEAA